MVRPNLKWRRQFRLENVRFEHRRFNPEFENIRLEYSLSDRAESVGIVIYSLKGKGLRELSQEFKGGTNDEDEGFSRNTALACKHRFLRPFQTHPVKHLVVNEPRPEGQNHELWTGRDDDGEITLSGLYYAEIVALDPSGEGDISRTLVFANRSMPAVADVSDSPDPFSPDGDGKNDNTKISYTLLSPDSGELQVRISIRDNSGRLVKRFRLEQDPGRHSVVWSGEKMFGGTVENGVYEYEIRAHDGWFEKANPERGKITVRGVPEEKGTNDGGRGNNGSGKWENNDEKGDHGRGDGNGDCKGEDQIPSRGRDKKEKGRSKRRKGEH